VANLREGDKRTIKDIYIKEYELSLRELDKRAERREHKRSKDECTRDQSGV
jgi:hypothetical protein